MQVSGSRICFVVAAICAAVAAIAGGGVAGIALLPAAVFFIALGLAL